MRNLLLFALVFLAILVVSRPVWKRRNLPVQTINSVNPFGIMIPAARLSNTQRVEIAKDTLGVAFYRPVSIFLDRWSGKCEECDVAAAAGLSLILTVRNNGGGQVATTPPADIEAYKSEMAKVVDKYKPAVLVVENEENSQSLFFQGTPVQYHQELKAACEVAHSQNVKCTNGGLVSSLVVALVADSYTEAGEGKRADEYLKKALRPEQYQRYLGIAGKKIFADQVARGKSLLAGYKKAGADYVNFHWYVADTEALTEAVKYLELRTGLPAMSNETGQQGNEDPLQVTKAMGKIREINLPYAVWFSADVSGFGGARSLLNDDGSLRPNGQAFFAFIETSYK